MSSQHEVVSPVLLQVVRQLFTCPLLDRFYLVGGTALALQLGHRRSIDADLFTDAPFNSQEIADWITQNTHAREIETGRNLVRCFISNVKVDLLAHQYALLDAVSMGDGIRMAGLRDIAAMKLNAVTNRGARRDFWDLASLLDRFPLSSMIEFYSQKYPAGNRWSVIKSLCYFADADAEDTVISDVAGTSWERVKEKIRLASAGLVGG